MLRLAPSHLQALENTAITVSAYLDACDSGAKHVRLDPAYYKACGELLLTVFALVDPYQAFPGLLEMSAAAREVAESLHIGHRLEVSRLGYYPELSAVLNRIGSR